MSIYLPIAEIPIDIFLLIFIGLAGGLLAGIFGIGGGFIITPILIFIGVPAAVAVASSANQIIASSLTGFLAHWYRKNVDIKMGLYLLIGGLVGANIGVMIFTILQKIGQIDLAISLIYVIFLGGIGALMFYESLNAILIQKYGKKEQKKRRFSITKFLGFSRLKLYLKKIDLPYVVEFPKSGLKISVVLPIAVGVISGILASLMGIGGGFIIIPAMIYFLKMPAHIVVGTSLFQIIFTTALVTIMHAVSTNSVDMILAFFLIIGGVLGAQFGSKIGMRLPAEKLRFLLSVIIVIVCLRLAVELVMEPDYLYSLTLIEK